MSRRESKYSYRRECPGPCEGGNRRQQLACGMRRRVQDDEAVGPALAGPRPYEPASAARRQGKRARSQPHPDAWAAVEQALQVPLQADPRVVGGRAVHDVGRERQRERLENRSCRHPQRISPRRADQRRRPRVHDVVLERLGDGQTVDPGLDSRFPRHVGQNRAAGELRVAGELERTRQRRERVRRRKRRWAPGRREDAQAAGRLERLAAVRVGRVVEAELLEQGDVNRVRVRMEELGAEIDGDAPPAVVDYAGIAVAADLRSRLEQVDGVSAG